MSEFSCPVVTIKTVMKHPDADKLDILTFEEIGWVCVDVKDKRKVGDKVVYIPIDAMVDCSRSEFEFLKKNAKMRKVYLGKIFDSEFPIEGSVDTYITRPIARIKTIRLRGQISQGLVIDVPKHQFLDGFAYEVGEDTSVHFGVTKYEPPQEAVFSVNAKGTFPSWCPKTDAERYQNVNRNLQTFDKELLIATVKLDGTSLTVFWDTKRIGDEVGVCSRNQELKDMTGEETAYGFKIDSYWEATKANALHAKVDAIAQKFNWDRVALQFELCGPGIQGNRLGLPQQRPFLFDIFYEKNGIGQYMDYENVVELSREMDITMVPIISLTTVLDDFGNPPDFSQFWDRKYTSNGHRIEGVVFVSRKEVYAGPKLPRLKFKVINPLYLLETEKE